MVRALGEMNEFQKVGVVGAGQMGNGIAQVVAMKNIPVVMVDIQQTALERDLQLLIKVVRD